MAHDSSTNPSPLLRSVDDCAFARTPWFRRYLQPLLRFLSQRRHGRLQYPCPPAPADLVVPPVRTHRFSEPRVLPEHVRHHVRDRAPPLRFTRASGILTFHWSPINS